MPALSCEACIRNVFLTKLTWFVVTEISHGTSVLKHTRLNKLIPWEMVTQSLSMDLSTQWPVLKFHDTTKAYHSMIVCVWNTWTTILMK